MTTVSEVSISEYARVCLGIKDPEKQKEFEKLWNAYQEHIFHGKSLDVPTEVQEYVQANTRRGLNVDELEIALSNFLLQ